jgi:hypothetical protein
MAEYRKASDDKKAQEVLAEAREEYSDDLAAWSENRNQGLNDLRFGMGEQWPIEIANQRQREGRPCLTINLQPSFIRQVVNEGRQNRPQIKVRPVDNNADVQTAKIFDGLIRHVESSSDADIAYDTALDSACRTGMGFFTIDVDYAYDDSFDQEIQFGRVGNPFAVVFDGESTAGDSSDWRRAFITELMDRDDFERMYPGADGGGFEGDDKVNPWCSENQVRLAQYWKKEEVERKVLLMSNGEVVDAERYEDPEVMEVFQMAGVVPTQERLTKSCNIIKRIISGQEILGETKWRGNIIPVIPVYGEEINLEGRRYFRSLIHDGKDAQRMFNYWRTTATELLALTPKAPWIAPKGAFKTDANKWATVNTQTWGTLEYDGAVPPQKQPFDQVPTGVLQEAINAADDMKRIIGIHDASLGVPGDEISGKAIRYRKHQADTSVYHFIDNLNRGIRCGGRVLIDLIPQVYSGPRIIRILGIDGKPQNVALSPPGQAQQVQPPQGFDRVYDITQGHYDLVVEAGPSYATRREESVESILSFISAFPASAPILGDMVAKMSDWPEHEEVAARLETLLPPNIQAQIKGQPPPPPQIPPEVMMAQQKAQADLQISMQKAQQAAQLEAQKAQNQQEREVLQAKADIQVEQMRAQAAMQIDREKAQLDFELARQKAQLEIDLELMKFQHVAQSRPVLQ